MIEIKEAKSAKEMKQFVDLPFDVYKNSPYWVPPIKKDDLASFDPKNDIFKTVDAKFFLSYKNKHPKNAHYHTTGVPKIQSYQQVIH